MAKNTVIEISVNQIKAVTGELKQNKFSIENVVIEPAEQDFYFSNNANIFNNQASRLNTVLEKLGPKNKKVSVVIPDAITYNNFKIYPKLREKELYAAVRFQADQFIPLPLNKVNIDIDVLEETVDKKKLLIMIVAVEKNHIQKIMELFEVVGYIPEKIENQLSALGKSITYANEIKLEDSLLINFDYTTTTVYFYNEQRRLIYNSHTFQNGYNLFVKELALTANITKDNAEKILTSTAINSNNLPEILKPVLSDFLREIYQSLNVAQSKYATPAKNIIFISGANKVLGLPQFTAQSLKTNLNQININEVIKEDKNKVLQKNPAYFNEIISCLGGLIN
ncbi:MAG: hypothetical protein KatS3mg090_0533 [Patescibacteria group bacterium]|nr:MAG: hypothetical protein KatS3mg090_0533 [Patescibacteria group bacterium]